MTETSPPQFLLMNRRRLLLGAGAGALAGLAPRAAEAVVRLDITQGNVQPLPIAITEFIPGGATEADAAHGVSGVITNNLQRSGLFAPINPQAFIEKITSTDRVPRFAAPPLAAIT